MPGRRPRPSWCLWHSCAWCQRTCEPTCTQGVPPCWKHTLTCFSFPVSCCCVVPIQPGSRLRAPSRCQRLAGGQRHSKSSFSQAGPFLWWYHGPLRALWHFPPTALAGPGQREGKMSGVNAALPQVAGQGRQHHSMFRSPTAVFLAFHHGQQPTLSLIWVPPAHSMKPKGVIRLVSPKTVQTLRALSHQWVCAA